MRRTEKQQWGEEENKKKNGGARGEKIGEEGRKEGRKERRDGMEAPTPKQGGHVPGVAISVYLLVHFRFFHGIYRVIRAWCMYCPLSTFCCSLASPSLPPTIWISHSA